MGLIKSGIYAGAAMYAVKSVTKAVGEQRNNQNQQQAQRQPQQMQFQQPSSQRGISPSGLDSDYVHQHFCNGQCQYQCNPNVNASRNAYAPATGDAAQFYNDSQPRQRSIEPVQEQLPEYMNSMSGGKNIDLASMAERFFKK